MEYGSGGTTGVDLKRSDNPTTPQGFELHQNYPNPFNPTTTISYSLEKTANVTLKIYNIRGELVTTLVDSRQAMGSHSVIWNGTDMNSSRVSSGIYIYCLDVNTTRLVKKMTLLK